LTPGRFLGWENADTASRTASDAIAVMDRRTWQALTTAMWNCRADASTLDCGFDCHARCSMS
jgi:hypothetical protein